MEENLIELERIGAIQDGLCGFLLDEVINPKGKFHSDPMISVARAELKKRHKKDAGADETSFSTDLYYQPVLNCLAWLLAWPAV